MGHVSGGRRRGVVWSIASMAVAVGLLVTGCGSDAETGTAPPPGTGATAGKASTDVTLASTGQPRRGGTLKYGIASETDGWNPTTNRWAGDGTEIGLAIFDPLAAYAADGSVVPYLAQSFEHNEGFTEWKIVLRDGPTFHDGTAVDSAAVKRTIDAHRASLLQSANLKPVTAVETPDAHTVVLTTDQPWSTLPVLFTGQAGSIPAPSQLDDPDSSRQPVGSGPFVFKSWTTDSSLVVERNPNYWRKDAQGEQLPYLDGITFTTITDSAQRVTALQSGDIDMTWTVDSGPVTEFRQMATDGDAQVLEQPGQTEVGFVMLNLAAPPFDDPNARLAMAHATDRDTYADVIGDGVITPARTLFRPGTPWYSDIPIPGFDLEAAKKDVANWSAAHGGEPLKFTLMIPPAPASARQAQLLLPMWQAAGMQVDIKQVEATSYLLESVMGNYQAVLWGQFGSPDPDYEQMWWRSTNANPIGQISINFPRHKDPATDQALDEARATADTAARKKAFDKVQERLAADLPYIYLSYVQPVVAANMKVRGMANGPLPDGAAPRPLGGPGSFSYHTFLTQTWLTE